MINELSLKLFSSYVSVTVSREVAYTLGGFGLNLFVARWWTSRWLDPSVDVGSSKGCGVSWIDFDEEASFFIRDEEGELGFTDHLED